MSLAQLYRLSLSWLGRGRPKGIVPTSAQDKGWADVEPIYILFFYGTGPDLTQTVWSGPVLSSPLNNVENFRLFTWTVEWIIIHFPLAEHWRRKKKKKKKNKKKEKEKRGGWPEGGVDGGVDGDWEEWRFLYFKQ